MLRIAVCVVSIHAFRGEGDCLQETEQPVFPSFQSTPSGGKATILHNAVFARFMFQSTPSGGKATQGFKAERAQMQEFQSTPSGGKATRRGKRMIAQTPHVSIHAFRGEGDTGSTGVSLALCVFQSTPSGGKATLVKHLTHFLWRYVSIHAFRGEGDTAISRAAVPCSRQIL